MIVGLGNPGPQYARNRHNIGFMVVDRLADAMVGGFRDKFNGQIIRGTVADKDVVLLKPMTWMNLSGTSVGAAATFFKVPQSELIVIHDELDLASADVRVKVGGGHAGHNGLRSIFEHFGKDFVRVRCGIGRPQKGDVTKYVLGDFSGEELITLPTMVDKAVEALSLILERGARAAQNVTNPKPPKPKKPKTTPDDRKPAPPNAEAPSSAEPSPGSSPAGSAPGSPEKA
jgi:PTH1 family peptidyl-tRNA hydrolase